MRTIVTVMIIFFPVFVVSQTLDQPADRNLLNPDTTEAISDTTDSDRVLSPGADPYVFYDSTAEPLVVMHAGAFLGMEELGMEATLRNTRSDLFATLFVSSLHGVQSDLQNYRRMMTIGLTGGKEVLFSASHRGPDASRFYGRVGPGLSLGGATPLQGSGMDYFIGIHSTVLIGGLAHLSRNTSVYAELGARTAWFPALNEVGVIAGPHLSIGFQFSSSGHIPPVRY